MSFKLETERLLLRRFALSDSPFILTLLNDPSFIENIRDAGVRDDEAAQNYLKNVPLKSYEDHGFGLFHVTEKSSGLPVGMCGLIKRDTLPFVDVGFAFLPQVFGRGYATEAATAVRDLGFIHFKLPRLIGIVSPSNEASVKVLTKIGMNFEKMVQLDPKDIELKLFGMSAVPGIGSLARYKFES